ncbi:MAG: RNase adapter RapZ [Bacteroidota bacterium]|nr:RNase adapter RapZ [Bacteroidota bacterium]
MKTTILSDLFYKWSSEKLLSLELLPISGSSREYYRIKSKNKSVIATINNDKTENIAFLNFTEHFRKNDLNVPEIYASEIEKGIYLQQDLGDTTLYNYLKANKEGGSFPQKIIDIYKKIIDELLKFQILGRSLDFSNAYPRHSFDKQSIMWDLNYFKYNFIKLAGVDFNEQFLEDDFNVFADYLLEANTDFFLYRDFQSRNIMIKDDKLFFIDYQGGRKGASQYDLASLLYDAKAEIPQNVKEELLEYFADKYEQKTNESKLEFLKYYYPYVLVRVLQACGAFGYRGFFEKKQHFLQSIPPALKNLKYLLSKVDVLERLPELTKVIEQIIESPKLKQLENKASEKFTVKIFSFSFKKQHPVDKSGNGGGFVFDCRFLPNPGRIEKYKKLTGKDKEVISFFEKKTEVDLFFNKVCSIVDSSIENYLFRDFKDIMISFGCTGGQHRSVYLAEQLQKYLLENKNVKVKLKHKEVVKDEE